MSKRIGWLKGLPCAGTALVLVLFASSSAFAAEMVKAEIPFAFNVGKKALPAGGYEFKIDRLNDEVTVMGTGSGKVPGALAPVLTMLSAPPHSTSDHAHLVFDHVASVYTLSEVWEAGGQGLLVHATKGPHEHHTVHAKK